jgi:hypothetical protein
METKVCKGKYGCNKDLPIESFDMVPTIQKGKRYWYRRTICNDCEKIRNRNRQYIKRAAIKASKPVVIKTTKFCNGTCQSTLPLDRFSILHVKRNNKIQEIYSPRCKVCVRKEAHIRYINSNKPRRTYAVRVLNASPKFFEGIKRRRNVWYSNHQVEALARVTAWKARSRQNCTFGYLKLLYVEKCKEHNEVPLEYTQEMWEADKHVLKARRAVNKAYKQFKLNNNENS